MLGDASKKHTQAIYLATNHRKCIKEGTDTLLFRKIPAQTLWCGVAALCCSVGDNEFRASRAGHWKVTSA